MTKETKPQRFNVWTVTGEDEDGNNGFWTRLGSAWSNKKGGMNVRLEGVPVNGRLVILPPTEGDETAPAGDGQ